MAPYEGVEKSVLMTLIGALPVHSGFRGRIDDERFLVGIACSGYSCHKPAWIVADLKSGHVGVVLTHTFDAAGQESEGLLVTAFRMACANPAPQAKLREISKAVPAEIPRLSRYPIASGTDPQTGQSACR